MPSRRFLLASSLFAAASIVVGRVSALPAPDEGGSAGIIGPDVIVGSVANISKYGTVGGISAYALGTTSCNLGDEYLLWCDSDVAGLCAKTDHPVIAQNLYRLRNGRVEQIGMSWLKHGFCALSGNLCGSCTVDPFGCDALGVGCSDPYDAVLNGDQNELGPRSEVNPVTGAFPYPYGAFGAGGTLGKRLQVKIDDLNPALNSGALYFGEGHYVTKDDAAAGNGNNNASYKRVTVGALTGGAYTLAVNGGTFQQKPAIVAWKEHGLGLNVPDPDVTLTNVDVAGDGRFILGCKVSDNGDGTWHYEYALFNMNSDRAAGSFAVPVPAGVTLSNVGQHLINHHSNEPYSTAAWSELAEDGMLRWASESFATNANAHALRWSTLFNFRFDADTPPVPGSATIGLFKPGAAADPQVSVLVPAAPPCPADLTLDGMVECADLGTLLAEWGGGGSGSPSADLNGDGVVDGADLGALLTAWGACGG